MGQFFDRQKCSEKCESLNLHFNYSKIVIGGIHVPAKNAKPLKLYLEGGGEKGRGTQALYTKVSAKCECYCTL